MSRANGHALNWCVMKPEISNIQISHKYCYLSLLLFLSHSVLNHTHQSELLSTDSDEVIQSHFKIIALFWFFFQMHIFKLCILMQILHEIYFHVKIFMKRQYKWQTDGQLEKMNQMRMEEKETISIAIDWQL